MTDSINVAGESLVSFEGFEVKGKLNENPDTKTFFAEAIFKSSDSAEDSKAVVLLEKTHFSEKDVETVFNKDTRLDCIFQNDIYSSYLCFPAITHPFKATVIHPATEKHIFKYTFKARHIIEETPVVYESVTLPYIQESKFDNQWVYNILEHKKEVERIVYEDPHPDIGFILVPDLLWGDCSSISNLHLTAIVHQRGIKSLRDLTADHLPLLENLLIKGSEAITKKYNVPESQLRIYLHYHPSYYHLHVHYTYLQFLPAGCSTEKAHLLTSVINNIKLSSSYYQNIPLAVVTSEGDLLLKKYQDYKSQNGGN